MKKNKGIIILIIILAIAMIVAGAILTLKILKAKQEKNNMAALEPTQDEVEIVEIEPPKTVQIYSGNDRPIAVMIDNHKGAWPQANLNEAYMVYEIIVEGAETRLMALYKGKNLEKIGPVRSSRHYFLDYAEENDAIYVHYGWSPRAQEDISTYKINNVNGLVESGAIFWRVSDKSAPHNAVTSTEKILKSAENHGYRTTSISDSVLNYVTDEVELEEGQVATNVNIPISYIQKVNYKYDETRKVYVRYARGEKQVDWETGEDVVAKNIIITFIDNASIDGEGRQDIYNLGTKNGYYITNGKAIPITCTKSGRFEQTVYENMQGEEIKVNDGNTFVQICPISTKVTFE